MNREEDEAGSAAPPGKSNLTLPSSLLFSLFSLFSPFPLRKYQYQATTAEDAMAATEPTPFADFFAPTADSFVGSLSGTAL